MSCYGQHRKWGICRHAKESKKAASLADDVKLWATEKNGEFVETRERIDKTTSHADGVTCYALGASYGKLRKW